MKILKLTFILICSLLFAISNLKAQAPEKINYQAVARNLAGVPLVNQTINVKYEIRQSLPTGTVVYAENHTLTTNQFGLFTAEIGGGTPITGTFPGIAWGTSPFYLFVEVDGDPMGVTQLLSVPYALYAKESANGPAGLPGKNSLTLSTLYSGPSCINGGIQVDAGLDDNNDGTLQALEIDYSYIICNGSNGTNGTNGIPGTNGINGVNGVDGISIDSTINNNDGTFTFYYSNSTSFTTSDLTGPAGTSGTTYFAGNGISLSGDTITNLGDLDNNPTNEIQILSINATQDTIFLSNGGYAVLPSSSSGFWSTFGGINIHNNNPGNVGIGTNTPIHQLSVASNDSVVASFIGTNPDVAAIVVASISPSASTGIVFFNGIDTTSYIFLNPASNSLIINNNSINGNIIINTDNAIVNQGITLANQIQNLIYNRTDTIFNQSPTGTIVNVNQGMFLTDSLYVLGNNAANLNWVLANDGAGQAKWTDPNLISSGGDQWGSQVVVTDTTLFGDGAGTPLSVNPNIIPTQTSQLINNSGFITSPNDADTSVTNEIELPATAVANQVLTWDGSAWIAQNAGSGADNWGSQVVVTDTTLTGTGIAGTPLSVNPNIIPTQTSQLTNNSGFITSPNDADFDPNNEIQTLSLFGDTLSISGGNSVNLNTLLGTDNDTSATNELQNLSNGGKVGNNQTINISGGTGVTFSVADADSSATNELQTITKIGSTVTLSNGGGSFTDDVNDADFNPTNEIQNLSVLGNNINISGGGTGTTFSTIAPALNQVLTWNGTNWVAQNAALGADNQDLSLAGNTLSLTNDGTPVNLTPFMDNTDAQTLSFVSPNLSILGGNTVNLSALTGPTYTAGTGINLAGNIITNTAPNQIVGLAGAGTTSIGGAYPNFTITSTEVDGSVSNELITSFGVNGANLELIEAGTIWNVPLTSFSAAGKWTQAGDSLFPTTLTNNVGIGTATPVSKLDVLNNNLNSGVNVSSTNALAGNLYGMQVSSSNGILNNKYGIVSTASGAGGNQYGLNGIASGAGIGTTYAVYGQNTATNTGNAFAGSFENSSTAAANKYGVYGVVAANGGQQYGVAGSVTGGGTGVTYGVSGNNSTSTTGDSYGGYFSNINASSTTNSYGIFTQSISANNNTKYGILASTNGGSVSATKYAVYGAAGGSGTVNYGIYGTANGATTNYAGYFNQGDVLINNTLILPTGASTGFVLTSDLVGNASWQPAAASGAWTSNGTQTFLNSNNDYVGIGTNNPLSKLHLLGTSDPLEVVLENGGGAFKTGYSVKTGAGQSWFMGKELTPNFVIKDETAGQVRFQIETSGNVGIGTTSPESMLHVALPNAANHKAFQLGHGNQPTLEWLFKVDEFSLFSIANENNGAEYTAMVIDANNGNVGIGTTIANSKLDVQTADNNVHAISSIHTGTNAHAGFFKINNAANNLNAVNATTNGAGAAINASNTYAGANAIRDGIYVTVIGAGGAGTVNKAGYFSASNASNNYAAIFDQGNVGIGTGAPSAKLHLEGSLRLNNLSGTAPAVGSVLTAIDAAGNAEWTPPSGATNAWNLTGNAGTNATTNFIGTTDNVALNFRVNNQTAGKIDSLYANSFFGFLAGATTSGTGAQNTAIGFQSLNANTTGGSNTALGYRSLRANLTGVQNTAVGADALQQNTGSNNTAIGYTSLRANTSGWQNTATGGYALYSNNTGSENTATGMNAMQNNTVGTQNTAHGTGALNMNSSGNRNTSYGYYALSSNINGSNGTAIGYYAMQYANDGAAFTNFNVAVGYEALRGSITPALNIGNNNTSLGYQTLMNNASGNFNTAVGQQAAFNNTSGGRNTAIGLYALFSNSTGNFNTALGDNALTNATSSNNTGIGRGAGSSITTGSNNTTIGYDAQVPTANGNNQVRIGDFNIGYAGVQVAWSVTSDKRYKSDIQNSNLGIDFINKLRPVSYIRNNDATKKTEYGFIAQELEDALNVSGASNNGIISKDDNGMYSVRYNDLFSPLVKAVQEQQQMIEAQLKMIEELKKEVEALKNKE